MEQSTKARIAATPLFVIAVVLFITVLFLKDEEYFQPMLEPTLIGIMWVSFGSLMLIIIGWKMERRETMLRDS